MRGQSQERGGGAPLEPLRLGPWPVPFQQPGPDLVAASGAKLSTEDRPLEMCEKVSQVSRRITEMRVIQVNQAHAASGNHDLMRVEIPMDRPEEGGLALEVAGESIGQCANPFANRRAEHHDRFGHRANCGGLCMARRASQIIAGPRMQRCKRSASQPNRLDREEGIANRFGERTPRNPFPGNGAVTSGTSDLPRNVQGPV